MAVYRPKNLHKLGVRPKRSLSQNFLIDQNIIRKTLDAAEVGPQDSILEIGPGPGAITEQLLDRGARVLAVEKDKTLAQRLIGKKNLEVLCDDALTFALDRIPPKTKIVANLPYHVATPILSRFLTRSDLIDTMTFFVQHEVGKRICAEVNSADYSSFSLYVRAYSEPLYCFCVSPNSFFPPPSVKSCVIHLKLKPFSLKVPEDSFFEFTRSAFGQKRKMLRGSLKKWCPPQEMEKALQTLGKNPLARPSELSLTEFATLYQKVSPSQ